MKLAIVASKPRIGSLEEQQTQHVCSTVNVWGVRKGVGVRTQVGKTKVGWVCGECGG